MAASETDNSYAWSRVAISLALATIGGIGLWASVVALPAIQVEFGIDRAGASLPYTLTMLGFAVGGLMMGHIADRHGITLPLLIGAIALGAGFLFSALTHSYIQFLILQFLLIGLLGSSATFAPLVADVSQWFLARRGIAIAIVAGGNYLAGTIWPPISNTRFRPMAGAPHSWPSALCASGRWFHWPSCCVAVRFIKIGQVLPANPLERMDCCSGRLFFSHCWLLPVSPAAWLCRCPSPPSPIAVIWDMGWRAAPKCYL